MVAIAAHTHKICRARVSHIEIPTPILLVWLSNCHSARPQPRNEPAGRIVTIAAIVDEVTLRLRKVEAVGAKH
jgi:hypothetical protein